MKKLSFLLLLIIGTSSLGAMERSESEMEAIALQQLKGAGVKSIGNRLSVSLKCLQRNTSFSIYGTEDNDGFVIVSRDDEVRPVLGYSTSSFDADNLPCGFQWWLDNMSDQLQTAKKASVQRQANTAYVPVAPMMKTKWHQNHPYNCMTPECNTAGGKDHALTGCLATSLAQILNYNEYPASASFMGYYFVDPPAEDMSNIKTALVNSTYSWPLKTSYGRYFPDGYQSEYDWEEMAYTDAEAIQIGTLMRDCGYAVGMQYGVSGSGALTSDVPSALINCFQYPKAAVKYLERNFYTDEEWMRIIYDEFSKGYPILYGGEDPNKGGHAFMIHGIDENGLVYVSWGWSGNNDGYFALDGLNTDTGNFNTNHQMVIGLRSQVLNNDRFSSLFLALEPYTFEWHPQYSNALCITLNACYNVSYNAITFNGKVSFILEDMTSGTVSDVLYHDYSQDGCDYYSGWGDPGSHYVVKFTPNHHYKFYLASKADEEESYSPIRVMKKGLLYYDVTVDAEGTPSFSEPQYVPTAVKSTKQTETDGIARVYDLQGRLLRSASATSMSSWKTPRGLSIVKQGNRVRKIVGRAQ